MRIPVLISVVPDRSAGVIAVRLAALRRPGKPAIGLAVARAILTDRALSGTVRPLLLAGGAVTRLPEIALRIEAARAARRLLERLASRAVRTVLMRSAIIATGWPIIAPGRAIGSLFGPGSALFAPVRARTALSREGRAPVAAVARPGR